MGCASEQRGAGQEKKLPFHVHLAQKSDHFTRKMFGRCLWILRALLSMGKPKRLQGLHPLGVTKVSTRVQVPLQVEKKGCRGALCWTAMGEKGGAEMQIQRLEQKWYNQ